MKRSDPLPPHARRGKTLSVRDMTRAQMLGIVYPADVERPRTRADCVNGPRPCPWVSCRHHLYVDPAPNGSLHFPHWGLDVDEVPATCSLDLAERRDGMTIEQIGAILGVTRERVRQIEESAVRKIRHLPILREVRRTG